MTETSDPHSFFFTCIMSYEKITFWRPKRCYENKIKTNLQKTMNFVTYIYLVQHIRPVMLVTSCRKLAQFITKLISKLTTT